MSTEIRPRACRYDAGTNEDYHNGNGVSRSMVEVFRDDPWKYHELYVSERMERPGPTSQMVRGTALHELVLEGEFKTFAAVPADCSDKRTTAYKTWAADNQGKEHLKQQDIGDLFGAAQSIKEHPAASQLLFNGGESEVAIEMEHEDTGLHLKCRLDKLIEQEGTTVVVDLKTTADATPKGFQSSCYKFGYHRQQAFYSQLAAELTGKPVRFYFVAVEMSQPYRVEVYELDEEFVAEGHDELFRDPDSEAGMGLLGRLAAAYDEDLWRPPHYGKVLTIGLPRYARYDAEYQV